jgi:hypothetical protein
VTVKSQEPLSAPMGQEAGLMHVAAVW